MPKSELAASHLLNLVDDLLDLARIEAGVATVTTMAVSLRSVHEEVEQIAAPLAQKRARGSGSTPTSR